MANEVARSLRKRMTPQEVKLWVHLRTWRARGIHFRRQAPILSFVVDFVCLKQKLVVEVDGDQHGRHVAGSADRVRDAALGSAGFRVLRIWNNDVDHDLDSVLDTILATIEERSPPTALRAVPPPRTGEG